MRRADRARQREYRLFLQVLAGVALAVGLVGLLFFHGRAVSTSAPLREAPVLTLEAADRRYSDQVAALSARTDKAGRLELVQTLALWGNDTNRQSDKGRQAEVVARKLLAEYPKDVDVLTSLGYALEVQGQLDEAKKVYTQSKDLNPLNTDVLWRLAHVNTLSGDEFRARVLLRETLQIDPSQSQAQTLQGYYEIKDGDVDSAIVRFKRAADSAPNARTKAEALLNLSQAYLIKKDTPQALERAKQGIATDPSYSSMWVGYARTLLAGNGDLVEARRAAEQALALYPLQSHAHIVLAEIAKDNKDIKGQVQELELARKAVYEDNTLFANSRGQLELTLFINSSVAAASIPDASVTVAILREGLKRYPVQVKAFLVQDKARGYKTFQALQNDSSFTTFVDSLGK